MKTLLFSAGILCLMYLVSKSLYKCGNKAELLLFVLLMVYTIYEGVAQLQGLPQILLVHPIEKLLEPVGRWLEQRLR